MRSKERNCKKIVALHEVGHTIIALHTPHRENIEFVKVFKQDSEWRGCLKLDTSSKCNSFSEVDLKYDIAVAIGGPLAQLKLAPETFLSELSELCKKEGGLLLAAKKILEKRLKIEVNWFQDLEIWLQFCKSPNIFPLSQDEFIDIESRVTSFFEREKIAKLARAIKAALVKKETLKKSDLLQYHFAELDLNFK